MSQEEGEEDDQTVRTGFTTRARTARRSEWATTAIFSDGKTAARSGARSRGTAHTTSARTDRTTPNRAADGLYDGEGDVMDLLDARTSRRMVRSRAGPVPRAPEDSDFDMDDGRLVIKDEDAAQVNPCFPCAESVSETTMVHHRGAFPHESLFGWTCSCNLAMVVPVTAALPSVANKHASSPPSTLTLHLHSP